MGEEPPLFGHSVAPVLLVSYATQLGIVGDLDNGERVRGDLRGPRLARAVAEQRAACQCCELSSTMLCPRLALDEEGRTRSTATETMRGCSVLAVLALAAAGAHAAVDVTGAVRLGVGASTPTALRLDGGWKETSTRADGSFTFYNIPEGAFTVLGCRDRRLGRAGP